MSTTDYLSVFEEKKAFWKRRNDRRRHIMSEKFNCECGGKYTYNHKLEHFRSLKHQKYLTNNNLNTFEIKTTNSNKC